MTFRASLFLIWWYIKILLDLICSNCASSQLNNSGTEVNHMLIFQAVSIISTPDQDETDFTKCLHITINKTQNKKVCCGHTFLLSLFTSFFFKTLYYPQCKGWCHLAWVGLHQVKEQYTTKSDQSCGQCFNVYMASCHVLMENVSHFCQGIKESSLPSPLLPPPQLPTRTSREKESNMQFEFPHIFTRWTSTLLWLAWVEG